MDSQTLNMKTHDLSFFFLTERVRTKRKHLAHASLLFTDMSSMFDIDTSNLTAGWLGDWLIGYPYLWSANSLRFDTLISKPCNIMSESILMSIYPKIIIKVETLFQNKSIRTSLFTLVHKLKNIYPFIPSAVLSAHPLTNSNLSLIRGVLVFFSSSC